MASSATSAATQLVIPHRLVSHSKRGDSSLIPHHDKTSNGPDYISAATSQPFAVSRSDDAHPIAASRP